MDLLTPLRAEGKSPVTGTNAPLCRLGNARLRHGQRYESRVHNSAPSSSGHTARRSGRRAHLDCVSWNFASLSPNRWGSRLSRLGGPNRDPAAGYGPYRGTARADGRSPRVRRLPRSAPSAGAAAAGDRGQPTGSGAFEQVVSNASSGSKPLSLDPVGQLRQGLHPPRNRRLSLLPPAFRSGVAYGRAACSAVRHERNCEPQGRSGQNRGSGRRGDLTAPTTEFLLKPRPPQPQRVADHADGGQPRRPGFDPL